MLQTVNRARTTLSTHPFVMNVSTFASLFEYSNYSPSGNWTNDTISGYLDPFSDNRTVLISSIMFTWGVAGNLIALLLMATSQTEQRQTMFYKLMACLALTDLLGTCATSPVVITTYVTGREMQEGSWLCHYFSFMMIFAGFSTMSLVCAMSIERYICVCHPYTYQCKMTKSYPKFSVAIALLLPLVVASLPLLGLGNNTVHFPKTWCFFDLESFEPTDVAFSYIYAGICLVSIMITFYCNMTAVLAVLAIKKRQRRLNALRGRGVRVPRSLSQRCAELHMIVILLGVTTIFMACYGPLVVFILIRRMEWMQNVGGTQRMYLLVVRIASSNQILDPWVYILVRRELRWKIISTFRSLLGIKRKRIVTDSGSQENLKDNNSSIRETINSSVSERRVMNGGTVRRYNHELDTEMTCSAFCFHCLCDPPFMKSPVTVPNASIVYSRRENFSNKQPSACMKSPLNRSSHCCVTCQPVQSDNLLLQVIANNQLHGQSIDENK